MGPVVGGLLSRQTLTQASTAPAVDTIPALTLEEASENRLLVLGQDGNVFTIDPEGGKRLDLTTDAGPNRVYAQPTWSSDGSRIAFTEVGERQNSRLVTVRADGTGRQRTNVPYAPFFFYWNPDGDRLAYLSNWINARQTTIALRVANFSEEQPSIQTVTVGQPLYFSWSPDGRQILTHIDNREVALTDLEGGRRVLVGQTSKFAVPQWLNDGTHLLYAINEAGRQQIVLSNLSGEVEQKIAFNGIASFYVSPNGQFLAFVDTPNAVGTNAFGPLYILGLEDQVYRQVSREPVILFAWSPNGESLLYMSVETFRGRTWLHNYVWRSEGITDLGRFRPTSVFFEQYLRFADQYAQSQSYWSPDSQSIVYSGTGQNGRSGIWVQRVGEESEPVFVAAGVHATWSPR
jgi:TolB protein